MQVPSPTNRGKLVEQRQIICEHTAANMLHMLDEKKIDSVQFKKIWYRAKQDILAQAGAVDEAGRIDETLLLRKLSSVALLFISLLMCFSVDQEELERPGRRAALKDRILAFFEVNILFHLVASYFC